MGSSNSKPKPPSNPKQPKSFGGLVLAEEERTLVEMLIAQEKETSNRLPELVAQIEKDGFMEEMRGKQELAIRRLRKERETFLGTMRD